MAKKPKSKPTTKAVKSAPKAANPALQADERIISLLAKENPKRSGTDSYERFNLYKNGMTIAQYIKAGGRRGDIAWDVARNFISLKGE